MSHGAASVFVGLNLWLAYQLGYSAGVRAMADGAAEAFASTRRNWSSAEQERAMARRR